MALDGLDLIAAIGSIPEIKVGDDYVEVTYPGLTEEQKQKLAAKLKIPINGDTIRLSKGHPYFRMIKQFSGMLASKVVRA